MTKKLDDLREYLFNALQSLSDKKEPMDIERAKAIADVGQVLVNSAKLEIEYLRHIGVKSGTGFFPDDGVKLKKIAHNKALEDLYGEKD